MLALLLLAAAVHHPDKPASMEGRLALIEARQMLEAQQVWALKAELPPEVLKALSDVELHVQHDIEQEDKIRDLSQTVALLQQRLASIELLIAEKSPVESTTRIPVMQVQALEVASKPSPRKAEKRRSQKAPKPKSP